MLEDALKMISQRQTLNKQKLMDFALSSVLGYKTSKGKGRSTVTYIQQAHHNIKIVDLQDIDMILQKF